MDPVLGFKGTMSPFLYPAKSVPSRSSAIVVAVSMRDYVDSFSTTFVGAASVGGGTS